MVSHIELLRNFGCLPRQVVDHRPDWLQLTAEVLLQPLVHLVEALLQLSQLQLQVGYLGKVHVEVRLHTPFDLSGHKFLVGRLLYFERDLCESFL